MAIAIAATSEASVNHFQGALRSRRQSAAIDAAVAAPPMARYCTIGVRSQALAASTAIVTRIHQTATPARSRWITLNALSLKRDDRSGDTACPERAKRRGGATDCPELVERPLPSEGDATRSDRGGHQARPAVDRARWHVRAARAAHASWRRYDHRRAARRRPVRRIPGAARSDARIRS